MLYIQSAITKSPTTFYNIEGVSKKSGQTFWSLQQNLFLEQKYTLDGQNYASKGLIWDIEHLCVSKTFGDMIMNVKKLYFKKSSFCNFFSKKVVIHFDLSSKNLDS